MNLLPKDERFFELFESQARILCRASDLLTKGLSEGYEGVCGIEEEMTRIEDEGDHIVHDIFGRLRSTFITPFDPEDIQALATSLDDVLDGIDDVTFRIVAYRLNPVPHAVLLLAEKVSSSCTFLAQAITALHHKKAVVELCIEVNRTMLAELFRNERDPIALIKQKEIYELLEATTDRCEDVADVIQNVSVKNN
jgi:uncharacterized protein